MTMTVIKVNANTIAVLKKGGIGVMPTDTIYGIVGSALKRKTVERIYKLRKRNKKKPMIILIGSLNQLGIFGIEPTTTTLRHLKQFWPGRVSVVLATSEMRQATWRKKWKYLHRGINSLAFRLPKLLWLRKLLVKTGPLVAPSANLEGKPPAKTIKKAKRYFSFSFGGWCAFGGGEKTSPVVQFPTSLRRRSHNRKFYYGVDFYTDGGVLRSKPSKIVKLIDGKAAILRE